MLLAKDGIFPITKDRNGKFLSQLPASGLSIPGTIQGEGKLCGIPSLFIRLAGCNLHCCWQTIDGRISPCDTTYAAYEIQGAYQASVNEIYDILLQNSSNLRHIVITGGEPLLQVNELKLLCNKLKNGSIHFHLTLETNATLFDEELANYIDLFSLSPKLSNSHQRQPTSPSLNLKTITSYIYYARKYDKDFQLKFVYSAESDLPEIKELLSQLEDWKPEDILLMPLGGTPEIMRINQMQTLECCIRNGWRYCDRLHISLFGDKQGV